MYEIDPFGFSVFTTDLYYFKPDRASSSVISRGKKNMQLPNLNALNHVFLDNYHFI